MRAPTPKRTAALSELTWGEFEPLLRRIIREEIAASETIEIKAPSVSPDKDRFRQRVFETTRSDGSSLRIASGPQWSRC